MVNDDMIIGIDENNIRYDITISLPTNWIEPEEFLIKYSEIINSVQPYD